MPPSAAQEPKAHSTTDSTPYGYGSAVSFIPNFDPDRPRPLVELRPELPACLSQIVERCLEKDPAARFPSAAALREALADLEREVSTGEALRTQESPTAKQTSVPASTAPERSGLELRRYRIAGIAVLAALFIAALGVWMFVRRAQDESERKAKIAEVEHLVDQGRFVHVWRIADAALQRWPRDPRLEH